MHLYTPNRWSMRGKGWKIQKQHESGQGCSSSVECLPSNAGSPGVNLQHCMKQVQWHQPLSPAQERWKQENQKYQSFLTTQWVEAGLGFIRTCLFVFKGKLHERHTELKEWFNTEISRIQKKWTSKAETTLEEVGQTWQKTSISDGPQVS